MKFKKRFLAFVIALCMSLCMFTTVFAAEVSDNNIASDGESWNLPENAVIFYQDANVVLYGTTKNYDTGISPLVDDNYGYAWVDDYKTGSFTVNNTITGRMGVTFKIEASDLNAHAQIWMENPYGLTIIATKDVYVKDYDVHMVIASGVKGVYKVHYIPLTVIDMRIMCWTYSV